MNPFCKYIVLLSALLICKCTLTYGQNTWRVDASLIKIDVENSGRLELLLPRVIRHTVSHVYPDHTADNSIITINEYTAVYNGDTLEIKTETQINSANDCAVYEFNFSKVSNKLRDEDRFADYFKYLLLHKKEQKLHLISYNHGNLITGCVGSYFTIQITGSNMNVIREITDTLEVEQ